MVRASFLRISCILFTLFFLFAISLYPLKRPKFQDPSGCAPWCSSKNRISSKLGSILETKTSAPQHPLDPLTIQEINQVRAILSYYEPFASSFPAIYSLSLDEPDKDQVLSWRKGDPLPPRKALVIALLNARTHILTVDLELGRVISDIVNSGSGYPTLSIQDDISTAVQVALANAEFNKSLIQRGISTSDLVCITPSAGWFGPDEENRRVIKVQCCVSEGTPNFYMRPIEGLTATVDIDNKEVVKISNTGRDIPIPKGTNTDYRFTAQNRPPEMEPINPISIEQPKGPSFRVEDGHIVKWANWEFHLKADQRAGLVISRAMVRDSESGELRSVMYKGFASELYVPYMDPDENWYFKTYMDAGEFGLGATAMALVPLNDCPRYSYYMDGIFVASDGQPFVQPSIICLFERYAGDISWRHSEGPIFGFEVCVHKLSCTFAY